MSYYPSASLHPIEMAYNHDYHSFDVHSKPANKINENRNRPLSGKWAQDSENRVYANNQVFVQMK